ncbi:CDP-alcohol phosphatidyltransferase family protein [Actinoplanes oblitus]|uniref:CDP-alcohol phosphatidyltransferase family protein n=1 Tax=Actinoplanes oblitus TaxID=3040509 RepID=A0ABY8W9Q7_9ACTN|nr:CDP-alcohol phosphatidyltransferase family protein [Actinoplanes oblitus]WIM93119.1 CDP-alcohol phosphatidyltransferase family protein [Actinoplanes oblitus]
MSTAPRTSPVVFGEYLDAANVVTLANGAVGGLALWLALAGRAGACLGLLFLAVVLDHVDGYVARRFLEPGTARRAFGARADSLADLLNFGAVPTAVISLTASSAQPVAALVGATFVVLGIVRLAHFDITAEPDPHLSTGLPTTYAGFLVGCLSALTVTGLVATGPYLVLCAVVAVAQIARLRLRMPGTGRCLGLVTGAAVVTTLVAVVLGDAGALVR